MEKQLSLTQSAFHCQEPRRAFTASSRFRSATDHNTLRLQHRCLWLDGFHTRDRSRPALPPPDVACQFLQHTRPADISASSGSLLSTPLESPPLKFFPRPKLHRLPEGRLLRPGILESGASCAFPALENHPRARCHRAALPIGESAYQRYQLGQDLASSALRDKGTPSSRPDTFHQQSPKRATIIMKLSCKPPQLWL